MRSTGLGGLSLQSLLLYSASVYHRCSFIRDVYHPIQLFLLAELIYYTSSNIISPSQLTVETGQTAKELHKRSGHGKACNMQDPKLMGRSVMNQGFGIGGLHTTFPVLAVMIIAKLG